MNLNYVFDNYILHKDNLLDFGFQQKNDKFILKNDLNDNTFYAKVIISDMTFDVRVYELDDDEEFLPFLAKESNGLYVAKVREEVNVLVQHILDECFEKIKVKEDLLKFVKDKYGTIPDSPWENMPKYHTLKTNENHKWYGLFMNIPYSYIKLDKEGNTDVLNIKVDAEKLSKLIDHQHYFPAYHMNKKYWITILLDKDTDVNKVKELIVSSYELVEKK